MEKCLINIVGQIVINWTKCSKYILENEIIPQNSVNLILFKKS